MEESIAYALYGEYCAAVGGVAFNGDPLPDAPTFFNDPLKSVKANAWRRVAILAIELTAPPPTKDD